LYFEVLVVLAEGVSDHLGCDGKPLELLGWNKKLLSTLNITFRNYDSYFAYTSCCMKLNFRIVVLWLLFYVCIVTYFKEIKHVCFVHNDIAERRSYFTFCVTMVLRYWVVSK
jgi:hypothetical protein